MENNVITEKSNASIQKPSYLSVSTILLIIVCLGLGYSGAWYLNKKNNKKIVVVDVEKIISKRKEEFTQKYSGQDVNDITTKDNMTNDIKEFAERLEEVIQSESREKIILSKGAVVSSDIEDITEKVLKDIWEN